MRFRYKRYLIIISWKGIKIIKDPSKQLFEDMRSMSEKYGSEAFDEFYKNK